MELVRGWSGAMTWNRVLASYGTGPLPLFDTAFRARWGASAWKPNDADKAAAAQLHIQLISRITTQRLGYLEGDEKTALKKVAKELGMSKSEAYRELQRSK